MPTPAMPKPTADTRRWYIATVLAQWRYNTALAERGYATEPSWHGLTVDCYHPWMLPRTWERREHVNPTTRQQARAKRLEALPLEKWPASYQAALGWTP
jgi:hypothetical protein